MEDTKVLCDSISVNKIMEDLCHKINFLESNIESMCQTLEALYGIDDNGSRFYSDNIPKIIYDLEDKIFCCQSQREKLYIQHSGYLKQIAALNNMMTNPIILGRPDLSLIDEDDLDF